MTVVNNDKLFNSVDKRYRQLLDEAKQKITTTRVQVAKAASRTQFELYWWLGQKIVASQSKHGWGKSVIEQLSKDLKQVFAGTAGFSPQNLWYMRKIYLEYAKTPILQQLVGEIPWGHNLVIMSKIKEFTEREYYINGVIEQGWTRDTLTMQINSNAYARHSLIKKQHNFTAALPQHLAEQANNTLEEII